MNAGRPETEASSAPRRCQAARSDILLQPTREMPRQMNPIVSVAVVSFILAICAVPILAMGVFAVVVFSPSLPQATTSNAFFSTLFSVPGAVGVILLIAGYMLSFKSESASRRGRISRCPDGATKNLKKRDGKSNRRKSSSRDRRRIYLPSSIMEH